MVFKGADRELELTGNLGGRGSLCFEAVGGLQINVNRFAARHREVSCGGCLGTPQEWTSVAGDPPLLLDAIPIPSPHHVMSEAPHVFLDTSEHSGIWSDDFTIPRS
jgi:hypothetical protein